MRTLLAQARKLPRVQQLMRPATSETAKNWAAYRARFIEPVRLKAEPDLLATPNARGWTRPGRNRGARQPDRGRDRDWKPCNGRHMGDFRVLDALATLAFDFRPSTRAQRPAARFSGTSWNSFAPDPAHRPGCHQRAWQLRRRDGHAPVHAQQLGEARGGL